MNPLLHTPVPVEAAPVGVTSSTKLLRLMGCGVSSHLIYMIPKPQRYVLLLPSNPEVDIYTQTSK